MRFEVLIIGDQEYVEPIPAHILGTPHPKDPRNAFLVISTRDGMIRLPALSKN